MTPRELLEAAKEVVEAGDEQGKTIKILADALKIYAQEARRCINIDGSTSMQWFGDDQGFRARQALKDAGVE